MLEVEEFDDDYFTPVASASLANIFGKPVTDVRPDNESLKYTPHRPQSIIQKKEDSKATSCVFACAVVGYLWHNNTYTPKGKIGFAILKKIELAAYNIILYDTNKTTLSNTIVSSKLKVDIKNKNYLSYYDDQAKYWSLYAAHGEIEKIVTLLKQFEATITTSTNSTDPNPPEPKERFETMLLKESNEQEPKERFETMLLKESNEQAGSDTDSSINRKTKASILNRMASMGHAILPPKAAGALQATDSDTDDHEKAMKHKTSKGIKKNSVHKKTLEYPQITEVKSGGEIENTFKNNQLLPISQTTILSNPSPIPIDLLLTEQRINNSELRINIGTMTDKVDKILTKISVLEMKDQAESNTKANTEITNKLLTEYENKIKAYENIIKQLGGTHNIQASSSGHSNSNIKIEESLNNKIELLEKEIKEKDTALSSIQAEVLMLSRDKEQQSILQKKMCDLQEELMINRVLLNDLTEKNEKLISTAGAVNNENVNRLKLLMNDTYQAVESTFEDELNYSGIMIKRIVCAIIRKMTMEALTD